MDPLAPSIEPGEAWVWYSATTWSDGFPAAATAAGAVGRAGKAVGVVLRRRSDAGGRGVMVGCDDGSAGAVDRAGRGVGTRRRGVMVFCGAGGRWRGRSSR